jgi:L-threonylcarbamoyladenylate synthase
MLSIMPAEIFEPNDQSIRNAAEILARGGILGMPTETVYGLAADATNEKAIAEIYAVKNRPEFNPLIVHVLDTEMAKNYVVWNAYAEKLASAFWPGPLTLVLPRTVGSPVSLLATAGLDSIAVRSPSHSVARDILAALGKGIAAPSANRSGRISPTTAAHVVEELGDAIYCVIDGGACAVGIESTVISLLGNSPVLLRSGSITPEDLEAVLQEKIQVSADEKILSPGQMLSHYSPSIAVRLNVKDPKPDEALIAFGNKIPFGAKKTLNLSNRGDLKEAAANLFATMRALDSPEFSGIAVMPIPDSGIGIAINDRLKRAAYP